ncbi:MAG: hypothetical protein ABJF01_25065 [bacterium]
MTQEDAPDKYDAQAEELVAAVELDAASLLHVLQKLPSGAGTEVFLDAMVGSHSDPDASPA